MPKHIPVNPTSVTTQKVSDLSELYVNTLHHITHQMLNVNVIMESVYILNDLQI